MRALVVFWSTPGLASMNHFAIFPSDIRSRGDFFHLLDYVPGIGYSVFFFQVFYSSTRATPGFVCMKQATSTARLIRTWYV